MKKLQKPVDADAPYGPAMAALPNDRWREFVKIICAFDGPIHSNGAPDYTEAARRAGFPDNGGAGIRVQAHRMAHDDRMQAAIKEEGARKVNALLPVSINAAMQILRDPDHRYHGKMVERMMTQGGLIPKSEVDHKIELSADEMIADILKFTRENNLDPKTLLGNAGVTIDEDGNVIE